MNLICGCLDLFLCFWGLVVCEDIEVNIFLVSWHFYRITFKYDFKTSDFQFIDSLTFSFIFSCFIFMFLCILSEMQFNFHFRDDNTILSSLLSFFDIFYMVFCLFKQQHMFKCFSSSLVRSWINWFFINSCQLFLSDQFCF